MPIPLSRIISLFLSLSITSLIASSSLAPISSFSLRAANLNLSKASEALDINSLKKMSLFEYKECITRSRTCLTSASNDLVLEL